MKSAPRLLLLLCALLLALPLAADEKETKAPPSMPSEVTLTSGRVLRNVQVMGWRNDAVMLKHSAGANTIAFSLIKSVTKEDLEAIRAAHAANAEKTAEAKRKIAALDAEIAASRAATAAAEARLEEARERASRAGELMVGQTEEQVRRFLGGWARRNKTRDMEQVIFELQRGVTYYVYFRDGRVVDWDEMQRRR
jgi:hypothetical protein